MVRELGLLAFCILLAITLIPVTDTPHPRYEEMKNAALRMEAALDYLSSYREEYGPSLSEEDDPNLTGIIGVGFSPITTTRGFLDIKRSTTNPDFAALMVKFFHDHNLAPGDRVSVSASASFPALYLATIIAGEEMGLDLQIISSIGSSSWGANHPDFTLIDMERVLLEGGLIATRSQYVSMGGRDDTGANFWEGGRELAREAVQRNDYELWYFDCFLESIAARLEFFDGGKPRMYVNVGGGDASLGRYPIQEMIQPGMNYYPLFPRPDDRGVAAEFLEKGVPVLNILQIRTFLERYNLPLDPQPLPGPGESDIYYVQRKCLSSSVLISVLGLSYLFKIKQIREEKYFNSDRDGEDREK